MKIREIMTDNVVTVDASEPAEEAWLMLQQLMIRHLIATANNRIVGIISERDLGGKNGEPTRRGRTVQDLMSTKIVTADPDMNLREAANLMRGWTVGCLPVLENDKLVGIVTATDVLDTMGRGASKPENMFRRPPAKVAPKKKKVARSKARL